MVSRNIDGPGREDEAFVTSEEAARFLRVSKDAFLRMVGKKKGTPLPGVPSWIRSYDHGHETLWDSLDVAVIKHILTHRHNSPAPGTTEAAAADEDG